MKQRQITILLIPVFILTICWVVFNVYHNYVSSTITDPLTYQIIPIKGNFDSKTISEVKERKRVNPANGILVNDATSSESNINQGEASDSANIDITLEENQ